MCADLIDYDDGGCPHGVIEGICQDCQVEYSVLISAPKSGVPRNVDLDVTKVVDELTEHYSNLLCSKKLASGFHLPDHPFSLEIAAGDRPTPGFIHHDFRLLDDIEIICDARHELYDLVGEQKLSAIRATHILEHFPYADTVNILRQWRKMLVIDGTIVIEVPNLTWQARAYARGEIDASEFVYYAYGGQDYEGNFHYAAFDQKLLSTKLEESGFIGINIVDIGQVLVATAINPSV